MRRLLTIVFFSAFFTQGTSFAQFTKKIDSLIAIYKGAENDSIRVIACGKLAEYYYIYQLDVQGDSVLQQQLKIAELSQNKNLVFAAYFGNAIMNINHKWARNETIERELRFLNQGLNFAKEEGRDDYIALSHVRIAEVNTKIGENATAFNNADIAAIISQNISNDSIKILATLSKGDSYQAKGESLLAFKTYTNAYENAMKAGNVTLESVSYHRFSSLFNSLKNKLVAKEYLLSSLELNKENKNYEGMISDYIALAKLTDEKSYIENALQLAKLLNLEEYIIQSKNLMYGYYTYIVANADSTFHFLKKNPEITQIWTNTGMPFYYMNIGEIYHYANKTDSAIYYLLLAQPGFEKDFKERNQRDLAEAIGQCYLNANNSGKAIEFYEKAISLTNQASDLSSEARYTQILSKLYSQVQNFEKAYYYASLGNSLKDSLQSLANQREIALVEVNSEKRKHDREMELAEQARITKRNLQYMAITIAVTVAFFLLIIIGMLPVSRLTIKLLGYFTFISLFEFIIVLIEPWLHHLTHGEPLKIWVIKIFLIAILVPMQHHLEHKLVGYLETRKMKVTFPLKKWWSRNKKIRESTIDEMEEDSAVL